MIAVNSPANLTLTELRRDIGQLHQVRHQLAERLDEAVNQLESRGAPPSILLIEDLRSYRNHLDRLAMVLGAEDERRSDSVSLVGLERLVDDRDCRQTAEQILEKLCGLRHVDIPDFAPLALCRQEASRLCELSVESIASERNADLLLLRQRRHPLNSLLRLCEEGERLSDSEWTVCHDDVATNYGRQLATALTRGRIQRDATAAESAQDSPLQPGSRNVESSTRGPALPVSTTEASSLKPASPPVPAPRIDSARPHFLVSPESSRSALVRTGSLPVAPLPAPPTSVPATTEIDDQSIFDATAANETIFDVSPPGSGHSTRLRGSSLIRDLAAIHQSNGDLASVPPRMAIAPAVAAPVIRSREAEGTADPEAVKTHLVRLIADDRLPLALQLTRCLEQRSDPPDFLLPSWLLRALILGRHLSYSKGEIARQLDEELREFRGELLADGSEDRRLALSIMVRAAALPAAILAGSALATGILRSFKITSGFSQLYNYCSRVALYGDRVAGSLMEMFRPQGTMTGASELDDLSLSTAAWLQETARKTVSYGRTSPLFLHAHWTLTAGTAVRHAEATVMWCKWQETLTLAQNLLKPVCEQSEGERNWVRQEITRLTTQVRVGSVEDLLRPGMPTISARGIVLPTDEMHSVILEAVAIANRWLRLCHQTSSAGSSPIPVEALELRDEILKRSDGVVAELSQHRQVTTSPLVHAAIGCCQATIRQIQAMFESRITLPLVESDPRHVLNADLLRIPGIELNDQWLPETDAGIVERELLAGLETSEMGWSESFDYHARAGDHEATGRLLELDVWANPMERESLKGQRQSQIAESRLTINAELDELAADIDALMNAGVCTVNEGGVFGQRLDRLRYELPRVVNFKAFRYQINQLQAALLRLRSTGSPMASIVTDLDSANVRNRPAAVALQLTPLPPTAFQSFDIFSGE